MPLIDDVVGLREKIEQMLFKINSDDEDLDEDYDTFRRRMKLDWPQNDPRSGLNGLSDVSLNSFKTDYEKYIANLNKYMLDQSMIADDTKLDGLSSETSAPEEDVAGLAETEDAEQAEDEEASLSGESPAEGDAATESAYSKWASNLGDELEDIIVNSLDPKSRSGVVTADDYPQIVGKIANSWAKIAKLSNTLGYKTKDDRKFDANDEQQIKDYVAEFVKEENSEKSTITSLQELSEALLIAIKKLEIASGEKFRSVSGSYDNLAATPAKTPAETSGPAPVVRTASNPPQDVSLQCGDVPIQDIIAAVIDAYKDSDPDAFKVNSFKETHDFQNQIHRLNVVRSDNGKPVAEWKYDKNNNSLEIKLNAYPPIDTLRAVKAAGIAPLVVKGTNVKTLVEVLKAAKDVGLEIQLDPHSISSINSNPSAVQELAAIGIEMEEIQRTKKYTPPTMAGPETTKSQKPEDAVDAAAAGEPVKPSKASPN